jgi:sortase A
MKAKAKRNGVLRALEIGFLLVGIAALTAYGLLELDQVRGQADLREQFARAEALESGAPREPLPAELPGDALRSEPQPLESEPQGRALGRLTSERIGLDVIIAEGVDHATLRRAAGHIPGTARLDGEGNIGVAAHRDTFFRPLRHIQEGDVLEIETHRDHYRYRVEWTAVVNPSDVRFLETSSASELTLVTCFPFYYVGPAPRRFIVRATRVEDGPTKAAASPRADS